MKKLFNGKTTLLANPTIERNLALMELLDQIGYSPSIAKEELVSYIRDGSRIGVNWIEGTYTTWSSISTWRTATFEEFVFEILKPEKPTFEKVQLDGRRYVLVESEVGRVTIFLGYNSNSPEFTFEDINKIKNAIDRLK